MKLGLDSYSFHRSFGDVRLGEAPIEERLPRGSLDVVDIAQGLGADAVSLQTCFLPSAASIDVAEWRTALGDTELVLAWGHPDGLAFGGAEHAVEDLCRWIEIAPALGCKLVRLVAGNSGTDRLGRPLEFLASTLSQVVETARKNRTQLALENHADLTVSELEELLLLVDDPALGVCLDTANALRVGDDPLEATRRLLPHLRMVHLKDVESGVFETSVGPRAVEYGTGVVPVRDIVAILVESRFPGHVVVELGFLGGGHVDEAALVTACFGWLAKVVEGDRIGSR